MRYKLIEKNGTFVVSKIKDGGVKNEPKFNDVRFSSYMSNENVSSNVSKNIHSINERFIEEGCSQKEEVKLNTKEEFKKENMFVKRRSDRGLLQQTLIASSFMFGLASFSHALTITKTSILSNIMNYNPLRNALFNSEFKLMDRLYWMIMIIAFGYGLLSLIKRDLQNFSMSVFLEFFNHVLIIVPLLFIWGTIYTSRHDVQYLEKIAPYSQWICLILGLILLVKAIFLFKKSILKKLI